MKDWFIWLNGKVVADYKRKDNALNYCGKIMVERGLDCDCDVLYIENFHTGEVIDIPLLRRVG